MDAAGQGSRLLCLAILFPVLAGCGIPAAENALQAATYVSLQSDLLLWTVAHSELNQFVNEFIGYRYFYRLYLDSPAGVSGFTDDLTVLDEGVDFNQVETVLLGQLGYRSLLPSGEDGNIATPSIAIPVTRQDQEVQLSVALDPSVGLDLVVPDGILLPDDADSSEDSVRLVRAENDGQRIGELSSSGFLAGDPDLVELLQEFPEVTLAGTVELRVALAVAAIGLSADGLRALYSGVTGIVEAPADGSGARSTDEAAEVFADLFALEVNL